MNFEIIELTSTRVKELIKIETDSNIAPWSESSFQNEFNLVHSCTLGALDKGQLCGFLVMHILLDELEIMNFAVAPDYRRCGIGSSLLRASIMLAKEKGASRALLEVRQGNTEAIKFYSCHGFNRCGVRLKYYGETGEDAILMEYMIS